MELLKTKHISKSFVTLSKEPLLVLQDISISIAQGEFLSIVGKSGSGKTTLMNILGCLDRPTSGNYFLEGEDISKKTANELARIRNQKIGFVFQTFNLLEDATALENVALPLLYAKIPTAEAQKRAADELIALGLEERMLYFPNKLSGGQRQRVAIARALVNRPALILADEPTGNLDSKTGIQTMEIFRKLNASLGITFVIVTHDDEIAASTDRIINLVDGIVVSTENKKS
ncbi:TPA: macrolide ABC transporter ATP-binding protein [Candidatus Dependentiae bacterium]|nr:macrolide ABC transporter ATP-binding protein [Candidatus Dependentiae bacterium]